MSGTPYVARRASKSRFVTVRGLRHHVLEWGTPRAGEAPLVLLHGWMDVAASFQFVVDALSTDRHAVAFDWRGFGETDTPAVDTYFFPEYLGDLDAMLGALAGDGPVDLVGHSMGGNVAMLYAGLRTVRVRRLVNLEGFGMPRSTPDKSPQRLALWLAALREPERLRVYDSLEAVAARLMTTNPLLRADRALWLAERWSAPVDEGARERRLLADPNHKRSSPIQPNVDEWLECWKRIEAPVCWIEGDRTDVSIWWNDRYTKAEFHRRLDLVRSPVERHVVAPAGHMLHHDRPEDVARIVEAFLSKSRAA